jgi:hypothetical protein
MRIFVFILMLIIAVTAGCSNVSKLPSSCNPMEEIPVSVSQTDLGNSVILESGMMNIDDGTIVRDTRNPEAYLDVTALLGSNFSFSIDGIIPPDILIINLRINNPTAITAYDVNIVFENLYGKTVTNPDGYIDIYQPYDIDPFIAFREGYPERAFPPGTDDQTLLLKYPSGANPMVKYFIIAHLGGNTGGVYQIAGLYPYGWLFSDGGTMRVYLGTYDWQSDVSTAVADTTVFTGGLTFFAPDPVYPNTWYADISNTQNAAAGTYQILVMATSPSSPQYNTYDYMTINVYDPGSDPTWLHDDIPIEGDTAFTNTSTFSAAGRNLHADDKTSYLTFFGSNNVSEGAVYFCKSTDDGDTWTTAIPITSTGDGLIEQNPSMWAQSNLILIAYEKGSTASGWDLRLAVSDDYGDTWSNCVVLNDPSANQNYPSICVIPAANYHVFIAYFDSAASKCVVADAFESNLTAWTLTTINSDPFTHSTEAPSIVYNSKTSKLNLAFGDFTSSTTHRRIWFASTNTLLDWNKPEIVHEDSVQPGYHDSFPSLSYDTSTGIPAILYRHYSSYGTIRFIKATNANATAWNTPVEITDPYSNEYCGKPGLFFESGRWLATWSQGSISNYSIRLHESFDGGLSFIQNGYYVNDLWYSSSAFNAGIAADGGNVLIAWTDNRSGRQEVYVEHGTHR